MSDKLLSVNNTASEILNGKSINAPAIKEEKLSVGEIFESVKNRSLKSYFLTGEGLKNTVKVFGQSEDEIEKEYKNYKAQKVFNKMGYLLIDNSLSTKNFITECEIAVKYQFSSVTVLPSFIKIAKSSVKNSVLVDALISYPYGEDSFIVKRKSVKDALKNGADKISYILSIKQIKNGEYKALETEIKKIGKICGKKPLSIVIDTSKLSPTEIVNCVLMARNLPKLEKLVCYSVALNELPDVSTVKEIIKTVDGKLTIAVGGNISTAEEVVSVLSLGAGVVISKNCPYIVKDALKKLDANN